MFQSIDRSRRPGVLVLRMSHTHVTRLLSAMPEDRSRFAPCVRVRVWTRPRSTQSQSHHFIHLRFLRRQAQITIMLRRAAARGCGGSASFVGKRALSSATPAPAAPAAVPQRLLQRHAHSTAGAAACGIQQRTRGRDSSISTSRNGMGALGFHTLPLSPSLLGHGQQQRGGGQQGSSWARLPPHAQWRALLSTAPPSKEDDKATVSASSLPSSGAYNGGVV